MRESTKEAIGWAVVGVASLFIVLCVFGCSAASPSISQTAGDGSTQTTETAGLKAEIGRLQAEVTVRDLALLKMETAIEARDVSVAKLETDIEARDVEVVAMKGKLKIATEVGGNMNAGWVVAVLGCVTPVCFVLYTLANRNRRFRRLKYGEFCQDPDEPP